MITPHYTCVDITDVNTLVIVIKELDRALNQLKRGKQRTTNAWGGPTSCWASMHLRWLCSTCFGVVISACNVEVIAWIYLDEMLTRDRTHHTGDSMFGNEVRPKPTSPGHAYGRSSPKPRHRPPGAPAKIASTPREPVTFVLLLSSGELQVQPPPPFYRGAGLHEPTPNSPNPILLITTQVHYNYH